MKKTMVSYRLEQETLDQIEWLADYLSERDCDHYTNTDIIKTTVQKYFWQIQISTILRETLNQKTLEQIEWLVEYLSNRDCDHYTNTDIISIAIQEYFSNMQEEKNT